MKEVQARYRLSLPHPFPSRPFRAGGPRYAGAGNGVAIRRGTDTGTGSAREQSACGVGKTPLTLRLGEISSLGRHQPAFRRAVSAGFPRGCTAVPQGVVGRRTGDERALVRSRLGPVGSARFAPPPEGIAETVQPRFVSLDDGFHARLARGRLGADRHSGPIRRL